MTQISEEQTQPSALTHAPWPLWVRLAFRFSFLYWALYALPSAGAASLVDLVPKGGDQLSQWMSWPLARLAHVVGVHIFHLTGEGVDWHPTGSGDTAMNYVLLVCLLALALIGTAIWSAIDERAGGRREYRTAYAWLRLFLRFTLAITLLEYGLSKVFPSQFGLGPRLFELNETYGESSPMHVLWFFMGMSRPYTVFGGIAEVIPGILLLFRRTSTLGLLGAAAVMANIVALNFCYDVTVKLYSTHLLLLAVYLLLPDLRPMWDFFVRRRESALAGVWVRKPERRALRIGAHILQGVVLFACVWSLGFGLYESRETPPTPSPLRGMWAVDSVAGWPDAVKPKTFILDNNSNIVAVLEGGKRKYFPVKYDAAAHSVKFTKQDKETALHWQQSDARSATLQGTWLGAPATFTLHRTDPDTYPLQTRGFHWVQEQPFNR